jgi:hypothetical protein
MKKTLLSIAMLGFGYGANAQYTPSASALPDGTIDEAYVGQVINFTIPLTADLDAGAVAGPVVASLGLPSIVTDPLLPFFAGQTVPLDVTNTTLLVTGLPNDVTATCDATPCTYIAGASGTITLGGMPTEAGSFTINITSSTNGDADLSAIAANDPSGLIPSTFALPQAVPGAFDEEGYTMNVTDPTNSIAESNEVFSLGLYPNPTEGISTLDVNSTVAGTATVEVYSITGSLVQTSVKPIRVGANRLSLDFTSVPAGIYLVKADINGHQALVRTQKK